MNIDYQVSPRLKLGIEVKDIKQGFAALAYCDSVFGVKQCGNCESPRLKFEHRQPQGYEYFSVVCQDCKHEFKFGQTREGGKLFPRGWEPPFKKGEKQGGGSRSQDKDREPAGAGASSGEDEIPW